MTIVITGGCGFIGSRLARRLHADGGITLPDGTIAPADRMVRIDLMAPSQPQNLGTIVTGDITEPGFWHRAVPDDTTILFHLAAVVSSAAEADFDLGLRVNVDAVRSLVDRCRALPRPPVLVFASSVAAFGLTPPIVTDETPLYPQGSYGAQKAMGELLFNDASRKGYLDARCLRLPTIVVRPGKPNKAASSFASGILREPLAGQVAECPVGRDALLWILSPDQVVEDFVHAAGLPASAFAGKRTVNLPGITVSVGDMVDALARAGGDPGLIQWVDQPEIDALVRSWPGRFETRRGLDLGFRADLSIDRIIAEHQRDMGRIA